MMNSLSVRILLGSATLAGLLLGSSLPALASSTVPTGTHTKTVQKQLVVKKKIVKVVATPKKKVSRSDSSLLVDHALSLQGIRYVFGGTSRSGFDCSGYVQYVFKGSGISLPRIASAQYKVGASVSRGQLQAGDLVFFTTYAPGASHVGIYLSGGSFISASNSGVSISNLNSGYYASRYFGARRVL